MRERERERYIWSQGRLPPLNYLIFFYIFIAPLSPPHTIYLEKNVGVSHCSSQIASRLIIIIILICFVMCQHIMAKERERERNASISQ